MKIYTRKGDAGATDLCCGNRVEKDHDRIEACGTVDELNVGQIQVDRYLLFAQQILGLIFKH